MRFVPMSVCQLAKTSVWGGGVKHTYLNQFNKNNTSNLDDPHADALRCSRLLHVGINRGGLDASRGVHLPDG